MLLYASVLFALMKPFVLILATEARSAVVTRARAREINIAQLSRIPYVCKIRGDMNEYAYVFFMIENRLIRKIMNNDAANHLK